MVLPADRLKRLAAALAVPARVLAAIVGGYGVTALATALLARLLPLPAAEASIAATLASFALFAVIALACFSARSGLRVWLWLAGAAVLLGAALWLSLRIGGRL